MTSTTTGPLCGALATIGELYRLQRREEPRHADGKAGRGNILAAETARPARRSGRRRQPSRSGSDGPCRPWRRGSDRPRKPGRCNIQARAPPKGRELMRFHYSPPPWRARRWRAIRPRPPARARGRSDGFGQRGQGLGIGGATRDGEGQHLVDGLGVKIGALGEIAGFVLAAARRAAARTPSGPSRSSLSMARKTTRRRPASSAPPRPIASITPSRILRLLILMQ